MKQHKHFHPIAAVVPLRKTWALCLLPLIKAALARDWAALPTALRQDAALLVFLLFTGWVLLRASAWELDGSGGVRLSWSLGIKHERTVCGGGTAAVVVERPLALRMAGASKVTLYPAGQPAKRKLTMYLTKHDAEALAEALMPAPQTVCRRPDGGQKLALAVLGANGLSTLALLALAVRESKGVFDDIEERALTRVGRVAAYAGRWLPAGAAWLLTLAALLYGISLLHSALQTANYEVWSSKDVLASRSGLISLRECRLSTARLSYADVRMSPAAMLLHCRPVYAAADGFDSPLPVFICRAGDEGLISELIPGFCMPPDTRPDTKGRSMAYFVPAGGPFAALVLLAVLAQRILPDVVWPLLLLAAYFAVRLGAAAAGFKREGVWPHEGHITLCRQKGMYLHYVCALHPELCLSQKQNPWAAAAHRADLELRLPGALSQKVRSITVNEAAACFEFLEKD